MVIDLPFFGIASKLFFSLRLMMLYCNNHHDSRRLTEATSAHSASVSSDRSIFGSNDFRVADECAYGRPS
jgi:hypothetical protein